MRDDSDVEVPDKQNKRKPLILRLHPENQATGRSDREPKDTEDRENQWKCPICYDKLKEPVVTRCGHAFCWPCLQQWLSLGNEDCPLCHGKVDREHLIPIYGQGQAANLSSAPRRSESFHSHRWGFPGFNGFTTYRVIPQNLITRQGVLQLLLLLFFVATFYI